VSELELDVKYSEVEFFEEKIGEHVHRVMLTKGSSRFFDKPFSVPKDSVFLMGDNRDNSRIAVTAAAVPIDQIKGRAEYIYARRFRRSHSGG